MTTLLIIIAAASGGFAIGYVFGCIQAAGRIEDAEQIPRELVGDFDTRQELIRNTNPDEA